MRKAWAAVPLATALLSACPDFGNLSGGTTSTDGGAATLDAEACPASQKSCVGKCVEQSDPSVGCSGECSACASAPNAQSQCVLQNNSEVCGTGTCNPQFGNCDDQAENGCETQITTTTNCGACGTSCAPLPYCEPSATAGSGYVCSSSCDAPNTVCGDGGTAECVNLLSNNGHCGSCGVTCAVSNGSGTCSGGSCAITCNTNYFLCKNACSLPSNAQCGSSCAACAAGKACDLSVGSATYGTCISVGSGGSPCDGGVNLTQDPNCGACGVDCASNGTKCCSGGFYLDGGKAPFRCMSAVGPSCGAMPG